MFASSFVLHNRLACVVQGPIKKVSDGSTSLEERNVQTVLDEAATIITQPGEVPLMLSLLFFASKPGCLLGVSARRVTNRL